MKFTIGLPVIKSEFLAETLTSITLQTFADYEVIIQSNVNEPEVKEEIRAICSPFLSDKRFSFYENETQLKIFDNFNSLLKKSSGEYMTILSDDDLITPDFLEKFNQLISEYPSINLYHCKVEQINELGETTAFTSPCDVFESLPEFMYNRLFNQRKQYLSDFVFKKDALIEMGGFPSFPGEGWGLDDLSWYIIGGKGVAYMKDACLKYRVNRCNFTNFKKINHTSRMDDVKFIYVNIFQITAQESFTANSILPIESMLSIIKDARIRSYLIVFNSYCKNHSLVQIIVFFMKNNKSHILLTKNLIKNIFKKIFFVS